MAKLKRYTIRIECWNHEWWKHEYGKPENGIRVISRTRIPRFDFYNWCFYHRYIVEAPLGYFPSDW